MASLFQIKPDHKPDIAEKLDWLRLFRTENVGPVTFYKLVETYGSARAALDALPELARQGGRKKPLYAPSKNDVEREYKKLIKLGGDMITAVDADYPIGLSALSDAPPVISVIGNTALLRQSCVAIVGARNASLNGKKFASKLARDLGGLGQTIVSGLARGIDTAAHEGSLASGTLAVVGGGIDVVYPEENTKLYEQIKAEGLIVAESPLGMPPVARHFPRRNRIVSGLSKAVIVVEATLKSGSLGTARLAGEQGRDVYAVPGHPFDPRASGPNALIRDGAVLVRRAEDVMEHLNDFTGGGFGEPSQPPAQFIDHTQKPPEVDDQMRRTVIENLSFHATPIDELIRVCHLRVGIVQTILLELELAGRLKRLPGNAVSLIE